MKKIYNQHIIKKLSLFIFYLLAIIIFFYYVNPMDNGFKNLDIKEAELTKIDRSDNFSSSDMIFYKSGTLRMKISLEDNKSGNVNIQIYKNYNHNPLHSLNINSSQPRVINIPVQKTDNIVIDVNRSLMKQGKNLRVYNRFRTDSFKYLKFIMVVFWILFLVLLFKYKYAYLFGILFSAFMLNIYAEMLNFGLATYESVLFYTFLCFCMGYLYIWIKQFSYKKSISFLLNKIAILLLIILPIFVIIYINIYHTTLTHNATNALFQTNFNEAVSFIETTLDHSWFLIVFLIVSLFAFTHYKQTQAECKHMEINFVVILIFASLVFFIFSNNPPKTIYHFLYNSSLFYENELVKYKKIQERRNKIDKILATKKNNEETYILVIGESQNRHHMNLYGYQRKTTPQLNLLKKDKNFFSLINVYAHQAYTTGVLSLALTEANNYNGKTYYDASSIIGIAKSANFETYWLTNQVLKGSWDNVISVIASRSDKLTGLNTNIGRDVSTTHYDGDLISYYEKILNQVSSKNRLIVIHLMGNHNNYCDRYPKTYAKYSDDLNESYFGSIAVQKGISSIINCYDNSIYYNDMVISKIIDILRQKVKVGGLIYFSDHSEDPDHNMAHSPDRFSYPMIDIPMFVYLTPEYKNRYPKAWKNFEKNSKKLFSNEFIYNTLLGMEQVETNATENQYNLFSEKYHFDDQNATILSGKKKFLDSNNSYYIQRKNIELMKEKKIVPIVTNISSYNMLSENLFLGLNFIPQKK